MARIRTIKPDFFRHEGLYEAEQQERLPLRVAFAGLWTVADREGRFIWSPRALKLDCLPYDEVDFSRVLDALWTRGFVVKYTVEEREYGYIPSWNNHQVINNREKDSSLPIPNENNSLTRDGRVNDACSTALMSAQAEGKGKEGKRKDDDEGDARARIPQRLPVDGAVELELILGPLTKQFGGAYPGPVNEAARKKFKALVHGGDSADAIIAGAECCKPEIAKSATVWLDERGWEQRDDRKEPLVTTEANALADRLTEIAGHDLAFIPPSWMGAPYRVQQWLSQGWPGELIEGSVREQCARRRGAPIKSIQYFEPGIADYIARQNAPVPKVVKLEAKKVEASRDRSNGGNVIAAADKLIDNVRELTRAPGLRGPEGAPPVRMLPEG